MKYLPFKINFKKILFKIFVSILLNFFYYFDLLNKAINTSVKAKGKKSVLTEL